MDIWFLNTMLIVVAFILGCFGFTAWLNRFNRTDQLDNMSVIAVCVIGVTVFLYAFIYGN